ncbi:MAG: histidinol-phosphate transaminase [Pseudomonadota bacterium]
MTYEREAISAMRGYSYGEQPELGGIIKLNTNENPYPPSPAVERALRDFDVTRLRVYPNALAADFRRAAAELHGVGTDNVMATNGGDEALRLAITTFLDAGQTFANAVPSYSLYPVLAAVQDAQRLDVPLDADFELPADFAAQVNAAGARLTCVVNPHAPSGRLIDRAQIEALAAAIDGVLLVDEAYVDFVDTDHDLTGLVANTPNLLLLRSMSKGYSLAGLRFGYLIGHAGLIKPMVEKTRDSYNVDAIAQRLALAALTDRHYARDNWAKVRANRERLAHALTALGFEVPATQTNFVLARTPNGESAQPLYEALKVQNILVRYFADLPDRLRITVGTTEENAALLRALGELVER